MAPSTRLFVQLLLFTLLCSTSPIQGELDVTPEAFSTTPSSISRASSFSPAPTTVTTGSFIVNGTSASTSAVDFTVASSPSTVSSTETSSLSVSAVQTSSVATSATTLGAAVSTDASKADESHHHGPIQSHPHHTHTRASAANCPDLLASHCTCGQAVYDALEPTHTVYVTNCSHANLTNLQLLQQLPDETEVLLLSHNQLTAIDQPLLGLADEYSPDSASESTQSIGLAHFQALSYRFANVKVLDLSNNQLRSFNGHVFAGLTQLRFLDLSNNSLQITGASFRPHLFKPLVALEHLRLARAFDDSEQSVNFVEDLTSMLIDGYLKQLSLLDLGHNHITQLPNPFAFCSLPSLQKLLLNDNRFNDRFELNLNCTPHLHLLDMRNNAIHRLSNATIDSFEQSGLLFHLELAGNPFWCDCRLRPTLSWLRSTRVWVVGAKQFLCQGGHSNEAWSQKAILEIDPNQLICSEGEIPSDQDTAAASLDVDHAAANVLQSTISQSHNIVSYTLFASLGLTLLVLGSALAFVSQRRVRSRCSTAIQQLLQKRQYSPLDKQRARVAETNCGESAEPVVTVESDTSSIAPKSNVDEDVV